ncbi:MAG: hypothetical protein BGO14_06840 [Chlamydiales bacterium 38-26]|nr:hypothetical protein [Chlamydiales bacterium]OJV08591.1 MAG: hypothetical protein BGO14_06840 [Chlamydiales bacterium 38-26]
MVKISCNEPGLNPALKEDIKPASQITFNGKTYRVTHITKVERSKWELIGRRILGGLITAFSLGMLYVFNQKVRELFQKTRQLHVTVKEDTGRIPKPLEEKKSENSSQNNPEHTQDTQKSETEPLGKTPPNSKEKSSHLPGVLIKYPSKQEVYHVPVLNQVKAEGDTYTARRIGMQRCGYHAFKNALIGLGILCQQKGFSQEQLSTKKDYLVCKHAIDFVIPPNRPVDMDSMDVSVANVVEALHSLRFPKVELDPELKPYHELLLSQFTNISAFNSEVEVVMDRQGNYLGTKPSGVLSGSEAGAAGLASVANLYEFVSKKGPKVQAFITGFGDHWITLLLHEDDKGTRVWSALDSYDSDDHLYKKCIDMYEATMQDMENFLMKSYLGAIGGEIKNKTRLFETYELDQIKDSEGQLIKVSKGKLLDPNDAGMLLKSARDTLDMLYHAYNFMRRVGWLGKNIPEDSPINGLRIQMTEYLRFYAINLRQMILSTPHLKEMVDTLCGEMSEVEPTVDVRASCFMRKLEQDPNYQIFKGEGGLLCKNVDLYFFESINPKKIQDTLKDSGWGCGWRAMMTAFSGIAEVQNVSLVDFYNEYRSHENVVQGYKDYGKPQDPAHNDEFLQDQVLICVEKSAPEYNREWAEPFIGKLLLDKNDISNSLERFGEFSGVIQSTLYENKNYSFEELMKRFQEHIKNFQVPIVIDDGVYAFNILGIHKKNDRFHLLINDPHTKIASEAVYILELDAKTGKQIKILAAQAENQEESYQKQYHSESLEKLHFNKSWMMLFPEPALETKS